MTLLYGKQRKVFKIIYKNYRYNKCKYISKIDICKISKLHIEEVKLICQELHQNGFLSYVGNDFKVIPTAKGIDYFSAETAISLEVALKSIFCPIIVAFITTLITLWLTSSS